MIRACAWIILIGATASAAAIPVDVQDQEKEAEIRSLTEVLEATDDPNARGALNGQIAQLQNEVDQHAVAQLHDAWTKETDPEKKKDIGDRVAEVAIQLRNYAEEDDDEAADQALKLIVEIATDGKFTQREIKVSGKAQPIALRIIKSFKPELADSSEPVPWVIRRMTSDRFEIWLTHHGWLFDSKRHLINEARPRRRDGAGREWYGAFLPDGRWVTTDLWEMDRTLHFFSRAGKWEKDVASDKIVPPKQKDDWPEPSLIGWCRCDRNGKGFVVDVGANGGRGTAWVNWNGEQRTLDDDYEPWRLCYRRDLEPKGMYTFLSVPDDRCAVAMTREEPGHGPEVGYPIYEAGKVHAQIPDGEKFGFWPGSDNVYAVTETTSSIQRATGECDQGPTTVRTWFYNADGNFTGWIDGGRIADTPSLDGMLFVDSTNRIITLTKDYRLNRIDRFIWPNKTTAKPHKIFPDIRLGFFDRGNDLVLASW